MSEIDEVMKRLETLWNKEPDEDYCCVQCGDSYQVDDGCDPSLLCHECAQRLVSDVVYVWPQLARLWKIEAALPKPIEIDKSNCCDEFKRGWNAAVAAMEKAIKGGGDDTASDARG